MTGPGRPPSAWRVASAIASAISPADRGSAAHLARPPSVATWSISWNASRPLTDRSTWPTSDEHRGRILAGGVDPDAEVRATDGARRQAGRRPAGQLSVCLGHERGRALVARRDDPDPGALERIEQTRGTIRPGR